MPIVLKYGSLNLLEPSGPIHGLYMECFTFCLKTIITFISKIPPENYPNKIYIFFKDPLPFFITTASASVPSNNSARTACY
jgi:hypothetical protein